MHKKIDIARALRDPAYRNTLTDTERAQLPAHPAGLSSFDDNVLRSISGGCTFTGCSTCNSPVGPTTVDWSCVGPNQQCP